MSVDRRKVFDGVFTRDEVHVNLEKESEGDFEEICKLLTKGSPESRIESHETFANQAGCDDPYVAIRVERLRGLLAQAKNIIVKGDDRRIAVAILADADNVRRDILQLQYTRSGIEFAASKRGLSRLYREAVAILKRDGADLPAKLVVKALEAAKVVRDESQTLHWTDDAGKQQETAWKSFDTNLSRHRKLVR